ncbi:MAG: hypothetical protein HC884_16005 [Chloroflexaceae bacterium]|nr:hypothetical protein [Chloroflexaceae bacterium]
MFKPFVQIDSSLSRQYQGTGLGLVMVARLTDLHGGCVSLESAVGRAVASRFRFRGKATGTGTSTSMGTSTATAMATGNRWEGADGTGWSPAGIGRKGNRIVQSPGRGHGLPRFCWLMIMRPASWR